ncbi:hypothetical protein EDB89DRAFT_2184862 [Lactarius sanguifluus]|nr:hypothetical protein EDB89DRAFT_2184862 [Lactarius sanguifluus]
MYVVYSHAPSGFTDSCARYPAPTGSQKLGWVANSFGRNMGDSFMVVVWPSHGADGEYNSMVLSQRKARTRSCRRRIRTLRSTPNSRSPIPTSPWRTPNSAQLDGMQNIIWAFSRTPRDWRTRMLPISIHHQIGRDMLNLTCISTIPAEPPVPLPPSSPKEDDHHYDEKAEDEGESHDDDAVGDGLRASCMARSVPLGSYSSYRLTVLALYVVGVMTVQRRFGSVKENAKGDWLRRKLGKRLTDIRGLLDRLDACMLSVNEQVALEPSRLEPFTPTVPHPSPSVTRKSDPLTVQSLAPPSHVTSPLRMRRPPQPQLRRTGGAASPDGRPAAAERRSLLRHAGGGPGGATRRGGDGGREPGGGEAGAARVHDHRGKALGNDVSDDIERRRRRDYVFSHVLCHSIHKRDGGRRPLASYEPVTFSGY